MENRKTHKDKRALIQHWADFDIFQLNNDETALDVIFSTNSNHLDALYLIDSMVQHHIGREYMLSNLDAMEKLVQSTFQIMQSQLGDSPTLQHSLCVLQRLSVRYLLICINNIRRQAQSLMNRMGVVEELLNVLDDHEQLSEYTLTFTLSLYMNLCLRSLGRQATFSNADYILELLIGLMKYDHTEMRIYINGILFNLFGESFIKEHAYDLDMKEVLYRLRDFVGPSMSEQIELLITKLDEGGVNLSHYFRSV